MNDNLRLAVETYDALGWSVFPIIPNGKTPAIEGWKERQYTKDELLEYVVTHPDTNLAIKTGLKSGVVVVDIDKPDLINDFLAEYPTDVVARTPRAGGHLYYNPDGTVLGNKVGFLPSKDFRADDGYVVAPPSHVKYPKIDYEGDYQWTSWGKPAHLYPGLKQQIFAKNEILKPVQSDLLTQIITRGFTEHEHNSELHQVACYLFGQGVSFTGVYAILKPLDEKDSTPQGEQALQATLKSAYNEIKRTKEIKKDLPISVRPIESVSIAEFMGMDYTVEWLIEDWLPKASIIEIGAPPETGKTWIGLDAIVSIALGLPFMGVEVKEALPVIIFQQEDPLGLIAQRIRTIIIAKTKDIEYEFREENGVIYFTSPWFAPIYIHQLSELSFNDMSSLERLEQLIIQKKIGFIYIDPLYTLGDSSNFFAEFGERFKETFKRFRRLYNVGFLIAHHTKKSGGDGRQALLGSQLMIGAFEGAWMLTPQGESIRIEVSGKFYAKKRSSYNIEFKINTNPGEEQYETLLEEAVIETAGKYGGEVYAYIEEHGSGTQGQIAKETGLHHTQVKRTLEKLVTEGVLITDGKKYTLKMEG